MRQLLVFFALCLAGCRSPAEHADSNTLVRVRVPGVSVNVQDPSRSATAVQVETFNRGP